MRLEKLEKTIIESGYYMNDVGIMRVGLATVIANRCHIGGRPVWMTLVGPSSMGKSQILEPLILTGRGETNEETGQRGQDYIVNIDDLTSKTLISGSNGADKSLLNDDFTNGILAMTDLTVLISKDGTERDQILSQFRKMYDGGFTKKTGNKAGFTEWEGYMGFLSGSTPTIYSFMEEVADMGERFLSYRMRNLDDDLITETAMFRPFDGKELNNKMAEYFDSYIKNIHAFYQGNSAPGDFKKYNHQLELTDIGDSNVREIIKIARFAEKLRTVTRHDFHGHVEKIPIPAGSARTAKQLLAYAETFSVMKKAEGKEFEEEDMEIIEWIGWSLANEEKRAILTHIAEETVSPTKNGIAKAIGIHELVIERILSNLIAVKVLRVADTVATTPQYTFFDNEIENRVRRLTGNPREEF